MGCARWLMGYGEWYGEHKLSTIGHKQALVFKL